MWDRILFSFTSNLWERTFDSQRYTEFHPRSIWVFKITIKIWVLERCIPHISILLKFARAVYLGNQTSQAFVTCSCPFLWLLVPVFVYGPWNVWSTSAYQLQTFQDNLRAYFWQISKRSQFFFFKVMVIDAGSWYFVELLSRFVCQIAISFYTFLRMAFRVIRPRRNTQILRAW